MIPLDVLFMYLLIFRSNYLIGKLRLASGFDQDEIQPNINRKTIIGIATIIIGGLILAESIPALLRQIYFYYVSFGAANLDISYFVFCGAKILIGLLFLGEQKRIVNFIARKSADETKDYL